jgi:hemerythrin superfamily protein
MQSQKSSSASASPRPKTSDASLRTTSIGTAATIFDLLIADHRAVAGVFEQLKKELEAREPAQKICVELLGKIDALLTPHARAEEELVYPAFKAREEANHPVAEGYEEHALVHLLCGQLKERSAVDDVWCAKAQVLMDLVEHHVREEENEMFAEARKGLDAEEGVALAAEFLAGKERISEELGLPPPESLELPPPARAQPAKASPGASRGSHAAQRVEDERGR